MEKKNRERKVVKHLFQILKPCEFFSGNNFLSCHSTLEVFNGPNRTSCSEQDAGDSV